MQSLRLNWNCWPWLHTTKNKFDTKTSTWQHEKAR